MQVEGDISRGGEKPVQREGKDVQREGKVCKGMERSSTKRGILLKGSGKAGVKG